MKTPLYLFKVSIVICALLCGITDHRVFAQKKDSLRAALSSHHADDTGKASLLYKLADVYKDENLDSLVYFANAGIALSDKIGFKNGKANCMRLMGLVYLRRNEYDKSIAYYKGAMAIDEQLGNKLKQAQVMRAIADIYYRQTKYAESIECYNKSIAISEAAHDAQGAGLSLANIGGIYIDQANYSEAMAYYFKGLKEFEVAKDPSGISMSLVNIATIYSAIGNYKQAKEYINKSLALSDQVNNKEVVFVNIVNIGVVYADMQDYKSALAAFIKGAQLADSIGDHTWKNMCLANIADSHYELGNYDSAFVKYSELLKQPEGVHDTSVMVMGQTCFGLIMLQKGQSKQAIFHLKQAYDIAKHKDLKKSIFDISGSLSTAYEQLHDYARALEYQKIHYNYHDSIDNKKNDKKVQQLQFDYELGKKETRIELLEKNKIIDRDRIEKQRITVWASCAGLLLLAIICILLYRLSQREKRNKEKILKQKEEIQQQASRLEDLNRFKDVTFSVLSHDLRAPLGALTKSMELIDENVMTPEEFMHLKPETQKQLGSLNILLDNLLNWAKGYMQGNLMDAPGEISLNDILQTNLKLLENTAAKKNLKMINNLHGPVMATGHSEQIDIIIRNLTMNAIKFSNNKGTITFDAIQKKDKVQIKITDEGVGMTQAQLDKLFTTTAGNTTYGTDGEKGTGLGLLLSFEFIKANSGTITVESEVNKGTSFTMELPAKGM